MSKFILNIVIRVIKGFTTRFNLKKFLKKFKKYTKSIKIAFDVY